LISYLQNIMSKINDLLVTESESYISALLAEHLPANIIFHDFNHALMIKKYAETIGGQTGLNAEEMNMLRISALFHEVGYVNSYEQSNEESIKIASAFLAEHNIDQQAIDHISEIIRSTKLPQNPKDKIAEVLCDADLMYIATESGIEQFDLLYDEAAMSAKKPGKRPVYEKGSIDSFTTHAYFTDFGKTSLQPAKEAAVRRLTERMNRRKLVDGKKESQEKKGITYSRGVDTMFRITARNQINLNSIADNKSNILISVNAIIISIIITMLAGNIGNMSGDIFPILVFLVICLITIIIAILSTRPNIVTRKFTDEDIKNKNVDLIFFGNFVKLEYDDYLRSLKEMMKDDDHLYSTMIKNQYSLGKILSKKFRLVKMAYNVFMIGIIITVIVFLLNYFIIKSPA
jgi:predicted metal-dependent HD superfamily phosphohydrolase